MMISHLRKLKSMDISRATDPKSPIEILKLKKPATFFLLPLSIFWLFILHSIYLISNREQL